ncbi:MAG: 4-alpha-glucanotransferase [Chloroflexi bacterium RBG_16_50_9]|nr:MAG: 4-alpha-glucanotransferase [Chloroflexi bacterium RBG_16_50_9]
MSANPETRFLHRLARLYGVQTAYYDIFHQRQIASAESLLVMLRSLGAPVASFEDVPQAWREKRQALWRRLIEPVTVARQGESPLIKVYLPSGSDEAPLDCSLELETGEQNCWSCPGKDLPVILTTELENNRYFVKELALPDNLPLGYHRLKVANKGRQAESLIISTPSHGYSTAVSERVWGLFLPLYALHSRESWGCGDFSDLERLAVWVAGKGGQIAATLPILTTFSEDDFHPAPYLPISRLLWNEFFLDINRVPELKECPAAQELISSSPFQDEIEALRRLRLVDYARQMALKRKILEELSRCLFAGGSRRLEELHQFIKANPLVDDYAGFRATFEKQGAPWKAWPKPLCDGTLATGDYVEETKRYHLYAQWLTHQQMEKVSAAAGENNIKLYLDLPLGVHPDGYDVWREREAFLTGATAGAPPDAVFTCGQNWDFPPLHPQQIREDGYRYLRACLQHQLRYAGILRIDHVMGLHRLFCIPRGIKASQGVYLHYRAEELYAILSLEAYYRKAIIVGEDLGMVPGYVRPAMKKHGFYGMYVLHYELASNPKKGGLPVPRNSVASLNTHDMPPFASFWEGHDIPQRRRLSLVDEAGARQEQASRQEMVEALKASLRRHGWLGESAADTLSVLKVCLSFLADSQAQFILVNLEDLWLEMQPQNIPSTVDEYPNWRQKARYSFEEFCRMPGVLEILDTISGLRHGNKQQRRKNR